MYYYILMLFHFCYIRESHFFDTYLRNIYQVSGYYGRDVNLGIGKDGTAIVQFTSHHSCYLIQD